MTTPEFPSGSVPIPLPSALGAVGAAIATGIANAGESDPISVRRRWAVILEINSDATVDIDLGGVEVPHVAYDASYHPAVGEVVQVNVVDTDITVIGPTANSTYVSYVRRTGTVVVVNRSGSAPGSPTSVNVTLSDAQNPVTILNVPFVSPYFPTVGDEVMLGQGMNTNVYLVLGAVNRIFRRPTGDIEPSLIIKANTLALNGQTVSRSTYAALWAWAQVNGLVTAGMFTTGDGSTTFGLPDFRGRVPVGVGTLGSDTYALGNTGGSARSTLTTAQMPAHDHNVTAVTVAAGAHDHSGTTAGGGSHAHAGQTNLGGVHSHAGSTQGMSENGVHSHGLPTVWSNQAHTHAGSAGYVSEAPSPNNGFGVPNATTATASTTHIHGFTTDTEADHVHNFGTDTEAAHTHTFTTDTEAAHTHTVNVTESTIGGTTAVDLRSPYLAVNWIVWV